MLLSEWGLKLNTVLNVTLNLEYWKFACKCSHYDSDDKSLFWSYWSTPTYCRYRSIHLTKLIRTLAWYESTKKSLILSGQLSHCSAKFHAVARTHTTHAYIQSRWRCCKFLSDCIPCLTEVRLSTNLPEPVSFFCALLSSQASLVWNFLLSCSGGEHNI